ncbi:hypothetical protein M9H77_00835 [Catharanthus roseus]|uniref:Uncharacterized protein n=1 Tax=Catharanthus roseus TaxID=4058 RepID=A0ACC0C487_CATRO|nr:hypothetical protein M9H77_00835 [Catharanthus roseus]
MGSSSMRLFAIASILMMLFMSTEMGTLMVVEARTCESPSHRFHGVCVRGSNCGAVCNTEGFPGGSCRGFRRRCFCNKPC